MVISLEDLGFLDDRRPILRPIVGIGCVDDDLSGDVLHLQKTFQAQLEESPNELSLEWKRGENPGDSGLIEQLYERCEAYGWLWRLDKEEFARRIAVTGYVQAGILAFRVPAASAEARVGSAPFMRRFAYHYSDQDLE